jgi:hypothetical protein
MARQKRKINPWGKPSANRSLMIYVPSTQDMSKPITQGQMKKRVKGTVDFLNRTFGGSTRVVGVGSWTDPVSGKVIDENVTMVETITNDK